MNSEHVMHKFPLLSFNITVKKKIVALLTENTAFFSCSCWYFKSFTAHHFYVAATTSNAHAALHINSSRITLSILSYTSFSHEFGFCDRSAFSGTLLHACVILLKSTHPKGFQRFQCTASQTRIGMACRPPTTGQSQLCEFCSLS